MVSGERRKSQKVLLLAASELSGNAAGRALRDHGISTEDEIKLVVPVMAPSRLAERVGELDFGTVIVATHPDSEVTFAEEDLANHVAGRVEVDVVHLVVDPDEPRPLQDVEEIEAGPLVEERMERRAARQVRDLLALFVAVLGTVLMGVLLFGASHLRDGDPQGVIQALLAVGVFFLAFWGGAEVLFGEAVDRRRGATGTVATVILLAVPAAVVVSAILAIT